MAEPTFQAAPDGSVQVEIRQGDVWASRLTSLKMEVYFEGERIPTGGVMGVMTDEAHRHRGLATACMRAAIEMQKRDGQVLSLLFGIPDFYEPFGYVSVMSWCDGWLSAEIEVAHPADLDTGAADPATCSMLYDAQAHVRVGSAVRSRQGPGAHLDRWRRSGHPLGVTVDGQTIGYVCYGESGADELEVVEAGAMPGNLPLVLAQAVLTARDRGVTTIRLSLPGDDPFARLAALHGARLEARPLPSGGGMFQILDLATFCSRVTRALRRRIALPLEAVPREVVVGTGETSGVLTLGGSGPGRRSRDR